MALTLSTGLKNAQLNAMLNGSGAADFDDGKLQIWTGSPPGANEAPTGTMLWEETLPADAWAAASAGAAAKNGTWNAAAVADGTAGYFRMITDTDGGAQSTTDRRIEGTCGEAGSGADMILQNTDIADEQDITITTAVLTHGG